MIKVTKEAIVTSPLDAVADAPSEWGDAPMYWGDEKPKPDWDSAPEGATHWSVCDEDLHSRWLRHFENEWYWFSDHWVKYGKEGRVSIHVADAIPRPEQSKSTMTEAKINELSLRAEDADCVERWLDDMVAPKYENDLKLSLVGRIMRLPSTEPQEQEWDGEDGPYNGLVETQECKDGFPPVGAKVEMSYGKQFFEAVIEAYGVSGDSVMWDFEGVIDCASLEYCSFRPIQSTAERKRSKLISDLDEVLDHSNDDFAVTLADWLIDNDMLKDCY